MKPHTCRLAHVLPVIQRGDRLQFAYALVRDGVYASIVACDRAAMHCLAAEWFGGRDPIMRAEHLDRAGDPAAATAYLEAAAGEKRGGRTANALRLVERARTLAEDTETASRARLLHADLLADLEGFLNAIAVYQELAAADAETLCANRLGIAECLMRLETVRMAATSPSSRLRGPRFTEALEVNTPVRRGDRVQRRGLRPAGSAHAPPAISSIESFTKLDLWVFFRYEYGKPQSPRPRRSWP